MVDDPSAVPEEFPAEEAQEWARDRLFALINRLDDQQYEVTQQINRIRALVEEWRQAPDSQWKVTAETTRLLKHWRNHEFQGIRPCFYQIEAVKTAIWLMEVAKEWLACND